MPSNKSDRKVSGPHTGERTQRVPLLFTPTEKAYYEKRAQDRNVTLANLIRTALRIAEGAPDEQGGGSVA